MRVRCRRERCSACSFSAAASSSQDRTSCRAGSEPASRSAARHRSSSRRAAEMRRRAASICSLRSRPCCRCRDDLSCGLGCAVGREQLAQPFVERVDDGLLRYQHVARVRVGDARIARTGGAAVVTACAVAGLTVHAPSAGGAKTSPPSGYGRDVAFGARCLAGAFTACARVQSSRETSASCVGSGDQIHDDGSFQRMRRT